LLRPATPQNIPWMFALVQQCSTMFNNVQKHATVKPCRQAMSHYVTVVYCCSLCEWAARLAMTWGLWLQARRLPFPTYLWRRPNVSELEPNWAKLSQIEPNLALASQRHGFVMICDDLWCALCNVHFWNVHFALHFESLNLSLFEEDPAAWPVERRQAWANCKPTGNVPAIIPQKVSSCKALSEAGIFDFWRRQCLWPLLHAARTRNMRNIHFLILPGVSLQELWLPMQLSSLHWGSSAWSAALHQRLLKLQKSNYFQDPSWMKLAN